MKKMIVGLCHKLQMFGVSMEGPANDHCNNQGVVKNTSSPESFLSKKHNVMNCHAFSKACAADIMRVAEDPTKPNLVDLFTADCTVSSCWLALFGDLLHKRNGQLDGSGSTLKMVLHPRFPFPSRE